MQALLVSEERRSFASEGATMAQQYSFEVCADKFAAVYAELLK